MFEHYRTFSYNLAGRDLTIETGKMAQLSNGSCLVRYGDTVILANATASPRRATASTSCPCPSILKKSSTRSARFRAASSRERAVRARRPSSPRAVTDRPIRPLFPKDLRNDVVLSLTVMSVDPDNSPEIAAMIGASIALTISDIPWNGPIGGVFVGYVDGEIVINPTFAQREKVVMIEAGAKEIADDIMYDAIMKAHEAIKPLVDFINSIRAEIGKEKFAYASCEIDPGDVRQGRIPRGRRCAQGARHRRQAHPRRGAQACLRARI